MGKAGVNQPTKKSVDAKKIILKYNKDFGGTLNDIETQILAGMLPKDYRDQVYIDKNGNSRKKNVKDFNRSTYYKYKRELKDAIAKGEELIPQPKRIEFLCRTNAFKEKVLERGLVMGMNQKEIAESIKTAEAEMSRLLNLVNPFSVIKFFKLCKLLGMDVLGAYDLYKTSFDEKKGVK